MGGRSRWSVALTATLLCLWLPLLHSASDPSVRAHPDNSARTGAETSLRRPSRAISPPPQPDGDAPPRRPARSRPARRVRAPTPSHAASAHDRRNRSSCSCRPPPCARSSRCARGRPPRAPRARLFPSRAAVVERPPRAQSPPPDPVRRRNPPRDPPPRFAHDPPSSPAPPRVVADGGGLPIGARGVGQGAVAEGARQSAGQARRPPRARSEGPRREPERGGRGRPREAGPGLGPRREHPPPRGELREQAELHAVRGDGGGV